MVFLAQRVESPLDRVLTKETNYCDNSFIQESFMTNPDTVKLDLRHHEFIKYRNYHKWLFYHVILGPEQCLPLEIQSISNVMNGEYDTMMS